MAECVSEQDEAIEESSSSLEEMSSKAMQNAANAQASANGSKEMNAQEEHMRDFSGNSLLCSAEVPTATERRKDIKKPGL